MQYRIDNERFGQTTYGEAESVDAVVAEQAELLKGFAEDLYHEHNDYVTEDDYTMTREECLEQVTTEFRDAIEVLDETNERVIFDNGGGITLQLRGWAHYYQDESQAAEDVAVWLKSQDTSDWEGHEPEALACDPTGAEIRNGGYWIWTPVEDPIPSEDKLSGYAEREFFAALARLTA
jgi:hypothetical protein